MPDIYPDTCPSCQSDDLCGGLCAHCGHDETRVIDSCGCVFCDAGLRPEVQAGMRVHRKGVGYWAACERRSDVAES